MTVVYTGNLTWGALSANTIYIIASWTYDITAPIQMAECSALVSSGTVTLSGNVGSNPFIKIYETPNTIVENIHINGNGGETDGIKIESWNNFTLNNMKIESAYIAGITITESSSYGLVRNIETYNNHVWLRIMVYSTNIFLDSIIAYNNSIWVYFDDTHYTTWTNIQSYNNTWDNIFLTGSHSNNFTAIIATGSLSGNWLSLFDSDYNSITHFTWSNNTSWYWLYIDNWSGNVLTNIELYENTYGWSITWSSMGNTIYTMYTHNNDINFRIDTSYTTTLTDTIFSTGAYGWLLITDSTGSILSGITTYDNNNAGIRIHDSYYTTGINITSYNNNERWLHTYQCDYNYFDTIETYNNNSWWIALSSSTYNTLQNINTHDNQEQWIGISLSNYTLLSWIIVSGNTEEWVYITNSDYTIWINFDANTNERGIYIINSDNNSFTDIESYNNTEHNLSINNSNNNTFIDITANGSENAMWVYLNNSSNNDFMWLYTYGNYYAGIHLYNSNNNTWTAIVSNSNEGWLYMEKSTGNFIMNATIENNTKNGVMFVSGSNDNILSWAIVSGNMNHGIYMANSNDNTLYDVTSNNSYRIWLLIETGNNNTINSSIFNNNGIGGIRGWIHLDHVSWTIISNTTISWNNHNGISIGNSNNNEIINAVVNNNGFYGINLYLSDENIITWSTLSDNLIDSIFFYNANNNIISHTTAYCSWIGEWGSLRINNSTGNSINQFSGNRNIYEYHRLGLFQYTTYDSYTQDNNYIKNYSPNSATLTWNILSIWSNFLPYFNELEIEYGFNYLNLSWINLFSISGDNWDGKIYTPTSIVAGTKLATIGETGTDNIASFIETIEAVSWDTYLTMNEWTGTIVYQVSVWTSGQELKILKSNNGNIWTPNSLNSECVLDEDLICEFDFVDDFKLFAFWIPTNLFFTGYTFENEIITSGWYYNTWVYITFTGDYLSGATLDGNPYSSWENIIADGEHVFILTDSGNNSTGITFTIDTIDPTTTAISPLSGSTILTGNNINFLWTGDDDTVISNYELYVVWPSSRTISAGTDTGYTISSMLNNGSYTWHVIATDIAGNTWTSNSNPFIIKAPFTGQIILTWPNTTLISSQRFTKDYVNISMRANDPINYTITWSDFSLATWNFIWSQIHNILLTWTDGRKDVFVTMTNSSGEYISKIFTLYLDTQAPVPMLITPASGATITTPLTLTWNAWPDNNAGLSGYRYYVSTTNTFGTTIASWTTITPSVTLQSTQFSWPWTYYWYVVFVDKLGNLELSEVQTFIYSWVADTTPNQFTFEDEEDADLDDIYDSNIITITGMTPNVPVLATITNGALFISGTMVGTTGYIQNGWTVKIELISSDDYDETVSSTLTINGVSDTFSITTLEEDDDIEDYEDIDTDLSNSEKLMIIAIFETLKDLYAGDKEEEFLETLMVMLENKMDEYDEDDDQYIALKYLYDLTERYYDEGDFWDEDIDNVAWIRNGIYRAPNGKVYHITYDSSKQRFTSTDFVTPKYFPTLDTLKYIIDINNPVGSQYATAKTILARWKNAAIDGTRQSSPYTAPNKKVFYFFKDITERYSSYTFTSERRFNSLNEVKEFIYNTNK